MNPLWGDNFGSFLGASAADAGGGFAAGADTGTLSGQSLLWTGTGSSPSAASDTSQDTLWANPGYGQSTLWWDNGAQTLPSSNPSLVGGLLWADPGSATPNWLLNNSGAAQFSSGTDTGSPSQWLQFFGLTPPSETWLTQASNLLWTGGSGNPPNTPPTTVAPQLPTGFLAPNFTALPAEDVLWTNPSQSVPATLNGQPNTGLTPPNTLFGRT